jgi:hypothetical protein
MSLFPKSEAPAFDAATFSASLLSITEMMSIVADQVQGYRAGLEALGFSPTAAEVMAIEFHRTMLALVLPGPK